MLVGCLTSQQQASVSQARICSDNFTCCHTEIDVADQMFYFTQSQYTDTGPTSPSADPITPGAWLVGGRGEEERERERERHTDRQTDRDRDGREREGGRGRVREREGGGE